MSVAPHATCVDTVLVAVAGNEPSRGPQASGGLDGVSRLGGADDSGATYRPLGEPGPDPDSLLPRPVAPQLGDTCSLHHLGEGCPNALQDDSLSLPCCIRGVRRVGCGHGPGWAGPDRLGAGHLREPDDGQRARQQSGIRGGVRRRFERVRRHHRGVGHLHRWWGDVCEPVDRQRARQQPAAGGVRRWFDDLRRHRRPASSCWFEHLDRWWCDVRESDHRQRSRQQRHTQGLRVGFDGLRRNCRWVEHLDRWWCDVHESDHRQRARQQQRTQCLRGRLDGLRRNCRWVEHLNRWWGDVHESHHRQRARRERGLRRVRRRFDGVRGHLAVVSGWCEYFHRWWGDVREPDERQRPREQ